MTRLSIISSLVLLAALCASAASAEPAPAASPLADSGNQDAIKKRLVYVEGKLVDYVKGCTEDSFNKTPGPPAQGTGILLTKDRVLTAFHVAFETAPPELIRCFMVYRETDRKVMIARSVNNVEERSPQIGTKDLAILTLRDRLSDPSLNSCPSLRKASVKPVTDSLFIIGYDGKSINLRSGSPITAPKVFPAQLTESCLTPNLCEINKSIPGGLSGGPVVDQHNNLTGIFKGGDTFTSHYEPLQEVLNVLEPICQAFLTEDYVGYCTKMQIEKREEKRSFTVSKAIRCDKAGGLDNNVPLTYTAPLGSKIFEFVTHEDKTDEAGIGWVGRAEYNLSDDDQYVRSVAIRLGCSGQSGGKQGLAETRLFGTTKRILTSSDYDEIKAQCSR